ncbi:hypothetical protein NLG97_g8409 [Lecanicillium saksenae]|uniref:Uncharacterized protein n=1 Tax=Lecanicillium saksenae TaxID=468837 RepID=A0ACC1QIZ5_9HYPO|nr:hypothetical protein NLG97_g8409 [Lecanicillium saksenae]
MTKKYLEEDLCKAVEERNKNPEKKIADLVKEFKVPRSTLVRRLQGSKSAKGRRASNKLLEDVEEKAICTYVDHLDRLNLAVRPEFITHAANSILKARSSSSLPADEVPTVGKLWTTRFLKRNEYIKQRQRVIESQRKAAEDPNVINKYFQQLREVIDDEGIQPADIWNMDESGFRIGAGKDQLIITKRRHLHYFSSPENRESATVIEAISATGSFIPAFVILAGQKHMARWYLQELDDRMKISVTPTGFTNDEITFNWLAHFEEYTVKRQIMV